MVTASIHPSSLLCKSFLILKSIRGLSELLLLEPAQSPSGKGSMPPEGLGAC